ncbi:MAG: dephospho-CoA kinase [Synergistaceae bacterium]|nr:dephospho-CoA kinase [Synergistaceae bacterium]
MTTGTVMAITGDVGAGKSTVAKMFASLGGFLIDADRVVAELWRTPEVIEAAVGRWGEAVLDESGHVVHKRIAERIFGDQGEYDWVTGLLHPRVDKEIERRIDFLNINFLNLNQEKRSETPQWAVVEIPLLFEAGVAPWVTVTTFVTASRKTRAARCRARGWDEAEMTRRESFFLPSEERMARSDYVIRNDGGLEDLEKAVKAVRSKAICPKETRRAASSEGGL